MRPLILNIFFNGGYNMRLVKIPENKYYDY